MKGLRASVARTARWLSSVYALDLDFDAASFVIEHEGGDRPLVPGGPRSGVLAVEHDEELQLGLFLDPRDRADSGTIVEETSHLVCLAWHATWDLPISALVLEIQGEIDRFLFASSRGGHPFAHFEHFQWADWLDATVWSRYQVAHRAAHRYCRNLRRRFSRPLDTPALLTELRAFYRASPQAKMRAAAL